MPSYDLNHEARPLEIPVVENAVASVKSTNGPKYVVPRLSPLDRVKVGVGPTRAVSDLVAANGRSSESWSLLDKFDRDVLRIFDYW